MTAPARAGVSEALSRRGAALFEGLAGWKLPPQRTVHLSGPARLQGTAHLPSGSVSVYVPLSGTVELQGSGLASGYTAISHADSFNINGSFVSGWTRPNVYLSVYRGGRYVGGAWASGMVFVSGTYANGWVDLSGSGTLEADIQVQE